MFTKRKFSQEVRGCIGARAGGVHGPRRQEQRRHHHVRSLCQVFQDFSLEGFQEKGFFESKMGCFLRKLLKISCLSTWTKT